jgi:glucose/galactose transporter
MSQDSRLSKYVPVLSIGLLFFIFGFITWLNGALIPFLQMVCELTEVQALLVAFCFYIAYVVMALPMAKLLEITGYQTGMCVGLGIIAIGCVLFTPAALLKSFPIFLFAQFVVGSGLTILQTASNPFIVRLGDENSAAARIAFMGLLNKAAGVLAPIVFTALVLSGLPDVSMAELEKMPPEDKNTLIDTMAYSLIQPYLVMALALTCLAFLFSKVSLPNVQQSNTENNGTSEGFLHFPHLILGAVSLFFYVGVEVIAGDTIGLYGSSLGVENATALTSYTMVAMVLGYLVGLCFIPKFISQERALLGSALLGILFTLGILFSDTSSNSISTVLWGWTGIQTLPDPVALIALLGLANALVWPAIWPLALKDLGTFTAKGSALLIMGIAGGAILPLAYGLVSEQTNGQSAYWIMLPCYLFIVYYAMSGHKKRVW